MVGGDEEGINDSRAAEPAILGVGSIRNLLALCLALVVVSGAVIAHVHILSIGDDYRGHWAILDRVFDLLLASGIAALAFCLGRRMSRKLTLSFVGPAEEISFSIMLGTGVLGVSIAILGLAGQLKPVPTIAILVLFLLSSRTEIGALLSSVVSVSKHVGSSPGRAVAGALFVVLLVVLAARALTPPHYFEEAVYHLTVPKLFVEHGRVYPAISNPDGNLPFLVHMIYCICLMAKADIAAKVFSLMLAITAAISLYAFCARFVDRKTGALAMFAFFGAGIVVESSVTTRVDVAGAGMMFLALYAMAVCIETRSRGWFYASAILSGLSLGIEYTAFLGLGFILVIFLYESHRAKISLPIVLKRATVYGVISLSLGVPWLAKNAVWFHNPVYPYVTGQAADFGPGKIRYYNHDDQLRMDSFLGEARREIPSVVSSEEEALSNAASLREVRHPLRFWEYFTDPEKYNMAEQYADPNYLFALVPLLLFVRRTRWIVLCALFSAGFFVCMVSASWVARYLLPVYPPLTVAAVFAIVRLTDRVCKGTRFAIVLPAMAVAMPVLSAMLVCCVQTYKMRGVEFITGRISHRQFTLESYYFTPISYMNDQIPNDEGILMLGAEMAYGLNHPYIANAGWSNNEWSRLLLRNNSFEGVRDDLVNNGVRYVLFSPNLFTSSVATGPQGSGQLDALAHHSLSSWWHSRDSTSTSPEPTQGTKSSYGVELRNWATFSLFAAKFAEPVRTWRFGDFTLYRIK